MFPRVVLLQFYIIYEITQIVFSEYKRLLGIASAVEPETIHRGISRCKIHRLMKQFHDSRSGHVSVFMGHKTELLYSTRDLFNHTDYYSPYNATK